MFTRDSVADAGATTSQKPSRLSALKHYPAFESLAYRDFRWIWLGSFASFMAMNMQMITRGWLVLRLADDSPFALALVMMSFALPNSFMSLIGGALADRIPKKRMIMFSQGGNFVMTALLAVLDITGVITFWQLLAFGVVNGSLMAINMPSRQAIISEVVPENKIMNAVSLNNSGMNLTRILGPAVAGILIIFIDTSGVFFLIAGIYVFSVLAMLMIKAGEAPAHSRKSVVGDIKEGFTYTAADPTLRGLVIMAFIPSLFGFTYFALMPAWAREALNVQSDDLGYLMTVMGVGALVGTVILASVRNFSRRGMLLLMAALVWGMGMATFSQMTSFAGALPFLFLVGLLSSVYMSLNMTLLQIYASKEMRGRVMSLSMMTFGVMPLSAVPFGYVAEHIGTADALFISALMFVGATIIFSLAYPRFRRIA